MTPPVHLVAAARRDAPLAVLCEHASQNLPAPWRLPSSDRWLEGTHWAYDLGAEELAREIAACFGSVAVLSRFSRLLADPNRPEHAPDFIRTTAEGRLIRLNEAVDGTELRQRQRLWRAYHAAADRAVASSEAEVILAVHTFTPVFGEMARTVEVGVLFDEEQALAERLVTALAADGIVARLNEPYSGKEGLIYSVQRHATNHRRRALEIEVRQDLVASCDFRRRVVRALERLVGQSDSSAR